MSETLADSRCPLCGWVGCTDAPMCPECGHGLLSYGVTLHERETLADVDHIGSTPAVTVEIDQTQRAFERGP